MTEQTTTRDARENAPDLTGIVRRAEAAERVRGYMEKFGECPKCWVGKGLDGTRCERPAVMEVYGLMMCEEHGEEAADGALEELAHHAEEETQRLINPHIKALNPDLAGALARALGTLPGEVAGAGRGERRTPALLERAFPLDRERVDAETLAYIEDPDSEENREYAPPFDAFMDDRLLVCRMMREAFEERATWLVEVLEAGREQVAAQAAYALALEREAELRTR